MYGRIEIVEINWASFFGDWNRLRMSLGCLALTFVDQIPNFRFENKKNIKYEIIFPIFKKYCNQF